MSGEAPPTLIKDPTGEIPTPPARRRRKWRWVAIALMTSVVIAAIGVGAYLANYSPLSAENFGPRWCAGCDGKDLTPAASGKLVDTFLLTYQQGVEVGMGTSLFNNGPFPVRITGVYLSDAPDTVSLLMMDHADVAVPGAAGQTAPGSSSLEPFTPFTLGPGEQRWIVLWARFDNCSHYSVNSGVIWSQTEVSFRVLGVFPRHQWVTLPAVYEVNAPASCAAKP